MTCKPIWLAVAVLFFAHAARAQSYSIDWFTIDGGGGTSTGSVYSLSGTIGQPDAGLAMSGGNFSLSGGFWSLLAVVQMPGAPTLSILPSPTSHATISWTPSTPGFVLQETWSLSPANWTNSPSGTTNPVTLPASATKFFRLIKSN